MQWEMILKVLGVRNPPIASVSSQISLFQWPGPCFCQGSTWQQKIHYTLLKLERPICVLTVISVLAAIRNCFVPVIWWPESRQGWLPTICGLFSATRSRNSCIHFSRGSFATQSLLVSWGLRLLLKLHAKFSVYIYIHIYICELYGRGIHGFH